MRQGMFSRLLVVLGLGVLFCPPLGAQSCPRDVVLTLDQVTFAAPDLHNGVYLKVFDPAANDRSETGQPFELVSIQELGTGHALQLYPNGDGTVQATGLQHQVGTRYAEYTVQTDAGLQRTGTIRFVEAGAGPCLPFLRGDGFTVPAGQSSDLDVLANDDHPPCATLHLLPFPGNGLGVTAAGGTVQRVVVNHLESVRYTPPVWNYTGTDSFHYTAELGTTTATAQVTVTVVAAAEDPAFACYFPLFQSNRTRMDFDRYCARPSTRECLQTSGGEQVMARAAIATHCWNFGHEGNPATCNPNWTGGWVLEGPFGPCTDLDGDLNDDATGVRCTHYPTRVIYQYPAFGSYLTTYRITDTCGGSSSFTRDLDVTNRAPLAVIAEPVCQGLTCSFDGRGTTDDWGLGTLLWTFGDGTSHAAGAQVTHEFPRLGTYTVELLAEDVDGAASTARRVVTLVDQPPVPHFTWVCSDLTCALTSTATDDFGLVEERWRWKRVGTTGLTVFGLGRNVAFTAPTPGTYEIRLRATDTNGQVAEIAQQFDILGVLTAVSDNVVVPATANAVTFTPLVNDRGPVGGLQLLEVSPPTYGTVSVAGGSITYTLSGARPVGTDAFAYRIRDGAASEASGVIRVVAQPVGQVGRITDLTTSRRRIDFATPFPEPPVVFAQAVLTFWKDPVIARVAEVDTTGFTVWLQEPPATADGGAHGATTVHWLAVLPTVHLQPSGTYSANVGLLEGRVPYAAGRVALAGSSLASGVWSRVFLPEGLGDQAPAVFAQRQSEVDPGWATVRLDEVRPEGFSLALQAYQARTTDHPEESVAWVAFAPTTLHASLEVMLEAANTPAVFTDAWRLLPFEQVYPRFPLLLAGLGSRNDLDPATVRYRYLAEDRVELKVEEEQSQELDTSHAAEKVAYFAVEEALVLAGIPAVPLAGTQTSGPGSGSRQRQYFAAADDVVYYRGKSLKTLTIPVLANDRGKRSRIELAWITQPLHGLAWIHAPGVVRYQPPANFCGEDQFSYVVVDDLGNRQFATVWVTRERSSGGGGGSGNGNGNGNGNNDPCAAAPVGGGK